MNINEKIDTIEQVFLVTKPGQEIVLKDRRDRTLNDLDRLSGIDDRSAFRAEIMALSDRLQEGHDKSKAVVRKIFNDILDRVRTGRSDEVQMVLDMMRGQPAAETRLTFADAVQAGIADIIAAGDGDEFKAARRDFIRSATQAYLTDQRDAATRIERIFVDIRNAVHGIEGGDDPELQGTMIVLSGAIGILSTIEVMKTVELSTEEVTRDARTAFEKAPSHVLEEIIQDSVTGLDAMFPAPMDMGMGR